MGDSDMDYSLVLPEPQGCRWDQQREPVVILLGWAGCKDKHLAKYSAIYQGEGCVVIRFTAAWRTVFFAESFGLRSLRDQAKKLLELLFDYEIDENPIVFHVFSNGGFMLYRYMVELLRSHRQLSRLHVVGTIFDSAPGNRNVLGSVRALNTVLAPGTSRPLRYLALLLFTVMVFVLRILLYPATRFLHENHYDAMKSDPSLWPHLYLYSRSDRIIARSDIENMVAIRRRRRLTTQSVDFETSEHVSHYRRYPERYAAICRSFLIDCASKASAFSSEIPSF
ncbi:transmembrane protein 53 [Bufo gargarizans]|uniref:transmembrane protein 53 n=1 Tax=Bufo gargarizans TaxID=30331 RepID=UPI001CF3D094|nr:transmembrane protein 53 [Bufo gargarizans]